VASGRQTFLFTDLVGFTALAAQEGDDRAADVAHDLYRGVRRLLPEYGAEEVKTMGDGLMLRCDDPTRAVGLGLRIVAELEELPGFPPLRVGIHSGPAVEREGDWYGTTVNVAARLCTAAAGGEVLISAQTCEEAVELPGVEFGEQRLHWLKNVTEPVSARVAHLRRRTAARLGRFAGRGFIGEVTA
jgi:adenylate cyclase